MKSFLIFCCIWAQTLLTVELKADYLFWLIKSSPVPIPLVTTVDYSDAVPGALCEAGSHVKMGDTNLNMGWQNGFQISASAYVFEASYFLLQEATKKKLLITSGQIGAPAYAVPIFDVTGFWGLDGIPGETIYLLPGPLLGEFPGFAARFELKAATSLQGAQLNSLFKFTHFNALAGIRWISLHESLRFNVQSHSIPGFPGPASFFNSQDRFLTKNDFLGAQIGLQAHLGKHRWHFDGFLKGGLGATLEKANIKGTSISPGGNLFYLVLATEPLNIPGGIFAQPTNIGTYRQARFAAVIETGVNAHFSLNPHCTLNAGYDFLWISRVIRPGDEFDRKINPTLTGLGAASRATAGITPNPTPFGMPGPAQSPQGPKRPRFAFKPSNFWAQGFSIGLNVLF